MHSRWLTVVYMQDKNSNKYKRYRVHIKVTGKPTNEEELQREETKSINSEMCIV